MHIAPGQVGKRLTENDRPRTIRLGEIPSAAGYGIDRDRDRLLLEGAIEPVVWNAAIAYRTTWQQAFGGLWPARSLEMPAPIRFHNSPASFRLDALAKMRKLRRRLGAARYCVLELCVIEDLSWAEHGRRLGCDPKTARKRAIAALEAVFVTGLLQ